MLRIQVLFSNFQPIESTFQLLSRFREIYFDTKVLYQMSRLGSNHFKWRWPSILTNARIVSFVIFLQLEFDPRLIPNFRFQFPTNTDQSLFQ